MAVRSAVPSRTERVAQTVIRRWCASHLRRHALLCVEGREHIPARGPVLLVCRHVHHAYDGCVLLTAFPRPVHLLITLDWMPFVPVRRLMAKACRFARWPVVARAVHRSGIMPATSERATAGTSVRSAVRASADILQAGEILAVFPEGYPNIDPVYTPKLSLTDVIPFLPGFAAILDLAQRTRPEPIPVVPVGFSYEPGDRWRITMRCGPAVYRNPAESRASFVIAVQSKVIELSRP
jgi:1-acyl-sn-glycerol-3-phosphate acyltransferase